MTGQSDRVLRLVEDPDIKQAFQTVREYWRDKIEEVPLDNPEVLFDIRKMLHLLREVEDALVSTARETSWAYTCHPD